MSTNSRSGGIRAPGPHSPVAILFSMSRWISSIEMRHAFLLQDHPWASDAAFEILELLTIVPLSPSAKTVSMVYNIWLINRTPNEGQIAIAKVNGKKGFRPKCENAWRRD
uniref:hypothetical protein n=1 Tax=Agrobacterium fabrum TaxID=1176649 RepID=UPI0021BDA98F|nr:hypothetical protein [Agrobacterium fabrum]UVY99734.1 hypothetical protein K4M19_00044 [Agrobacterium fabrum]